MQTCDCITAIQFSENGKRIVVGFSSGSCMVYSCDSLGRLNYITRIDCKNRRGKFSSGRKVSGIVFLNKSEIIITTNDSRLRHYNLEDCI
jgi:WD40 repeat protein